MSQSIWTDVDDYIEKYLLPHDRVLEAALKASDAAHLPAIAVSPAQGKFLSLLVTMTGARLVLEIGTLGAYSTIWMARGLRAGGKIVTLEAEPKHAEVARTNIEHAGLSGTIEVRDGRAIDSLPKLYADGFYPFDLIFIDADKPSNAAYLDWAVKMSRPGTVIVCDNVVRGGALTDERSADPSVTGSREAFEFISANPRLEATALQTVGVKGYDGFAIAVVK